MGCPEVSVGLVFKNKPPVLTSPNILGLAADFTCRSADKGAFWPRVTRDVSGKEEGQEKHLYLAQELHGSAQVLVLHPWAAHFAAFALLLQSWSRSRSLYREEM